MQQQAILAELTDIFRDLFGNDGLVLTPATTAQDVKGWDSLKHIGLIVAVEDRFHIKMKSSEIERLANVGDLVRVIGGKAA